MPLELLLRNLYSCFKPVEGVLFITKNRFFLFEIVDKVLLIPFLHLLAFLRIFSFRTLIDIVGVDYPYSLKRLHIIYVLLSIRIFMRLNIKIKLKSNGGEVNKNFAIYDVPSITLLYNAAGWLEREIWDLLGVFFYENSDLRRILTDYGFEGFPLRKDFPLTGFFEVRYDDEQRSVIYEEVELTQEFRFFDFESPWKRINE